MQLDTHTRTDPTATQRRVFNAIAEKIGLSPSYLGWELFWRSRGYRIRALKCSSTAVPVVLVAMDGNSTVQICVSCAEREVQSLRQPYSSLNGKHCEQDSCAFYGERESA